MSKPQTVTSPPRDGEPVGPLSTENMTFKNEHDLQRRTGPLTENRDFNKDKLIKSEHDLQQWNMTLKSELEHFANEQAPQQWTRPSTSTLDRIFNSKHAETLTANMLVHSRIVTTHQTHRITSGRQQTRAQRKEALQLFLNDRLPPFTVAVYNTVNLIRFMLIVPRK